MHNDSKIATHIRRVKQSISVSNKERAMAVYKVGSGPFHLDILGAYNRCKGGDVIEFEAEFWPDISQYQPFVIKKDITLRGHLDHSKENTFKNVILGQLYIDDGAQVTLENLWFRNEQPGLVIQVTNQSTVHFKKTVIENTHPDNDKCLVGVHSGSSVTFDDLVTQSTAANSFMNFFNCTAKFHRADTNAQLSINENADIRISNSSLQQSNFSNIKASDSRVQLSDVTISGQSDQSVMLSLNHTELEATRTTIDNKGNTNSLNAKKDSSISLTECEFHSSNEKGDFPDVWLEASSLQAEGTIWKGQGSSAIIYALQQAEIALTACTLEAFTPNSTKQAITLNHTNFTATDTTMKVHRAANALYAENYSYLSLKNCELAGLGETADQAIIFLTQSEMEMSESSALQEGPSNVISMTNNSSLLLDQCELEGLSEDSFPTLAANQSTVQSKDSQIIKAPRRAATWIANNSFLDSNNDYFSVLNVVESRCKLHKARIGSQLLAENLSYIKAEEEIEFLGHLPGVIELVVRDDSTFIGDQLTVHRLDGETHLQIYNDSHVKLLECLRTDQPEKALGVDLADDSSYEWGGQNDQNPTASEIPQTGPVEEGQASQELENLIGLTSVKKEINKMLSMVTFNKKRQEKGLKAEDQTLHSVFLGNPGTGKTTVAKLMGQILFEHGALANKDEFIFVEASESQLVSQYIGQTAVQTQEILEKATGGILFIDEAYTLNKDSSSTNHGQEAIDTILKYMEDHRNEIMLIFAGYTKEMEEFLETNPGLKSRVPNHFHFEDYTSEEIVQIGQSIMTNNDYAFEDLDYYAQKLTKAYNLSLDRSNARWVRNFNEKVLRAMADRVVNEDCDDVSTIKNEDIDAVLQLGQYDGDDAENGLNKLNSLIGLETVKEQVEEFVSLVELNQRREEEGKVVKNLTLHSLFLGNPGTGKTTVARILGEIFYEKGVVSTNKFIEVSRSDLVGRYVGETAQKTQEVLKSALGGILFIDEAYTLSVGGGNDFGQEAINEILKFMEDHRRDIMIIFAGYYDEMQDFLASNSGLKSRIPNQFDFEDYTADQMVEMGLLQLTNTEYYLDQEAYRQLVLNNLAYTNDNSNGRWIRNLNEKLIRTASLRMKKDMAADTSLITSEDMDKVWEKGR